MRKILAIAVVAILGMAPAFAQTDTEPVKTIEEPVEDSSTSTDSSYNYKVFFSMFTDTYDIPDGAMDKDVIVPRYKLYETTNVYTSILLDTRTGATYQVQISIGDAKSSRLEIYRPDMWVLADKAVNGRFELYPTQNMYNFILLDTITGKTVQIQWSTEASSRGAFELADQISIGEGSYDSYTDSY